jgi:class 3 adenylate cyclase
LKRFGSVPARPGIRFSSYSTAPSARVRCGLELVDALAVIRVSIRVGSHSGEVALSGERVRGVAVHAAARIVAEAGSGEVLVSGTTRDLAEGAAGLAFELRGRYCLKGLEREHELFAAESSAG